jgi:transcription initiation factor TFIIIB Brf1 subunit/transcription initiation factor TFIIB
LDRETKKTVQDICLTLRIPVPNVIYDTAVEIATLHRRRVRLSGRKKHAVVAAAVYFSCKLHDAEREIRVFSSTCCMNAKLLNFGIKTIKEHLSDTQYMNCTEQQSKHYSLASQFINRLDMPPEHFKRLRRDVLDTIDSIPGLFDTGKKPRTILSAIILMSIRRMNMDVDKKKMFQTFRVCSQSVDNCATFIQNTYNV